MMKVRFGFVAFILSLTLLYGCKAKTATDNSAKPAPGASSNANASANSNKSNQPPAPGDKENSSRQSDSSRQLLGTYAAREIRDDKGITTMVSEHRTLISFLPDGTYSRVAQRKDGTTYHSDSGSFRIDAPDKLVLTIQVSDKKIQSPPLHRTHKFSLSDDGDELKMTSEKSVAVFRRVSKIKSS